MKLSPAADFRARAACVLVIDDNEGALHTVAAALRQAGFEVSEATSGAAGLALVRDAWLNAVVADQCLPDLTGLEVLAQLRTLGSRLPVVMMSGWPTPELRVRAKELGAFGFLTKPVWLDELVQEVQRAVQAESRPPDPEVIQRVEPASQGMSDLRQVAAELAEQDLPVATVATEASVSFTTGHQLLHKLVQLAVCPNLSVRELLIVAEAIRGVVSAQGCRSQWALSRTVLEALRRAEPPSVRRPLHAKVVEALAYLASLEGKDLRFSETDLARVIGISPCHLSRLVKFQTGLNLRQWKCAFRMRQAVQQLAGTDKDVSQIVAWLGCKYVSQFDDDFRDLFGLTPREFRKALRESSAPR